MVNVWLEDQEQQFFSTTESGLWSNAGKVRISCSRRCWKWQNMVYVYWG